MMVYGFGIGGRQGVVGVKMAGDLCEAYADAVL